MKGAPPSAQQTYRRRKLQDAARLLPVVGALLLALPVLWAAGSDSRSNGTDGLILFAIWFGLILAARLLAPALKDLPED